jgi:putative DNA primase/helicase
MNRPKVKDQARGHWKSILPTFGIGANFLTGKHGPCPMCGGKDRWRFDDKDGEGTWFCSGACGAGDGVKLVMLTQRLEFRDAAQRIETALGTAPRTSTREASDPKSDKAAMNKVWQLGARLTAQSVAGRYLAARTGISPVCNDLRAVAALPYFAQGERFSTPYPALIAMVRDVDGQPTNVHRTYLDPVGGKAKIDAPRKAMRGGSLAGGAAIRLAPFTDVLGIAEGIETALAASVLHGVPCWAAVTAIGLEQWRPPADVRVIVFGDNDQNMAGQKAAFALAHRLAMGGVSVEARIPTGQGEDWCDVLSRQLAQPKPQAA